MTPPRRAPIPESIRLLMPFSATAAGIRNPLGGKNNVRNKKNFVFGLGWQARLWEYFPMPLEGNFFYNLFVHRDYFLHHPPVASPLPPLRTIRRQPVWSLTDNGNTTPRVAPKASAGARTIPTKRCCLEPAGWYVPARLAGNATYGLHLSQGGLVNAAHQIHAHCPEEPFEVVLATTCHFIYCHLTVHAWIEDICALIDLQARFTGERSPYLAAHRRFGGLLLMEEIVCSMAAFSLLPGFLTTSREIMKSRAIPRFRAANIVVALKRWLKGKNCAQELPDDRPPFDNAPLFVAIVRLIEDLHGYANRYMPARTVGEFLDYAGMERDKGRIYPSPAWNRWDEYPVTIHKN